MELIGRPSRWSGVLLLTDDPNIHGAKPFRCDIIINGNLSQQDTRWRTLIHEMLHTFSAGYNPQDYQALRGWEEGVIEQLQRLLRPAVLAKLGVTVSDQVFDRVEGGHEYQKYVRALEDIRAHLDIGPEPFCLDLLATPIRDRQAFVFNKGLALPPERQMSFFTAFSAGNAVLKSGGMF